MNHLQEATTDAHKCITTSSKLSTEIFEQWVLRLNLTSAADCDLRPLDQDNVLVRNYSAYLVDFGVSRLDDETRGFSTQPMDQNPRYIARERIFNPSGDDDALKPTTLSDIYEFGSVFLEVRHGLGL